MYAIHSSVFSCMRRCCVCLGFLVTIGPCTCSLLLLCMMDMARVVLFKADATSTVGAIVWSKLNLQRHSAACAVFRIFIVNWGELIEGNNRCQCQCNAWAWPVRTYWSSVISHNESMDFAVCILHYRSCLQNNVTCFVTLSVRFPYNVYLSQWMYYL